MMVSHFLYALYPLSMYLLTSSLPAPIQTFISLTTLLSVLPQTTATGEMAFSLFQGGSTDLITPYSIVANTDGTNIVVGSNYKNGGNHGLIAQLNSAAQLTSAYEQSAGTNNALVDGVILDGMLYSACQSDAGGWAFHLSQNRLDTGAIQAAWRINGFSLDNALFFLIATSHHTLICVGATKPASGNVNFIIEFNPASGSVVSAGYISAPSGGVVTNIESMSDGSYLVAGYSGPQGWISKIQNNAGVWSGVWTKLYSSISNVRIQSLAESNNQVAFAGSVNGDALTGLLDGSTGSTQWITSVGAVGTDSLASVLFKPVVGQPGRNELMMVGTTSSGTLASTQGIWSLIMNNDGTLRKSVILDGAGNDQGASAALNQDGTITLIGTSNSYGSRNSLVAVKLDSNGYIDNSLLPSALNALDNLQSLVINAQVITNSAGSITFSLYNPSISSMISSVSVVNSPITTAWQQMSTHRPTSQPSAQPSIQPSPQPTGQPSRKPSAQPTGQPSVKPSIQPSGRPSAQPSTEPSGQPSAQPSIQPSGRPSAQPSTEPSGQPSAQPSAKPSGQPSAQPSAKPSGQPSAQPSAKPSGQPSAQPSVKPSGQPSAQPSVKPSGQPSAQPSAKPSGRPSAQPSARPSSQPSAQPSAEPSSQPSAQPSAEPSGQPSAQPSAEPSGQPSAQPSSEPSSQPSAQPSSEPSGQPSAQPSTAPSGQPSAQPSARPSGQPSAQPSARPSGQPSNQPSAEPSGQPSTQPSIQPSDHPSAQPSNQPSAQPSIQPSTQPSSQPTVQPSTQPSGQPTVQPSTQPSSQPTVQPSTQPSGQPTVQPSTQPSSQPTVQPTTQPSSEPSAQPTTQPSAQPTAQPSTQPSGQPTAHPSTQPSSQPSVNPSAKPSAHPSTQPSGQPSLQPTSLPTSAPSYSQAPTQLMNWNGTAQISQTSSINELINLNGKTFACGGVFQALCLQFDGFNGKISASFALPWDQNNALVAVGNGDVFVVGQLNGGQQFRFGRLDVSHQQFVWSYQISSQYAKFHTAALNQNQQLIAAGWDDSGRAVVAGMNPYNGQLAWGYSWKIASFQAFIQDIQSLPLSAGSCLAGYVIDTNYQSSILMMNINLGGALYVVNRLSNGDWSTMANCLSIDAVSGATIIGGATYSSLGTMNALIARVVNTQAGSIAWSIQFNNAADGQFTDVLIQDQRVYVVGYSAGFTAQKIDTIVLQLDATSGNILQSVRISGPGNTLCYSMIQTENGLRMACQADNKATLFFLDKDTFVPGNMPSEYQVYDDVLSVCKPMSTHLQINNIPFSQVEGVPRWPSNIFQPLDNQVVSSYPITQIFPENLPSARPTSAPTSAFPTQSPTRYPSSNPSPQPSSNPTNQPSGIPTVSPTISAHPTNQPSSSVPTGTHKPSVISTRAPTPLSVKPTKRPTARPSTYPSSVPTTPATAVLTKNPSYTPTNLQASPAPTPIWPVSPPTSMPSVNTLDGPNQGLHPIWIVFGAVLGGVTMIAIGIGGKYYAVCETKNVFIYKYSPEGDIENQLLPLVTDIFEDKTQLPAKITLLDRASEADIESSIKLSSESYSESDAEMSSASAEFASELEFESDIEAFINMSSSESSLELDTETLPSSNEPLSQLESDFGDESSIFATSQGNTQDSSIDPQSVSGADTNTSISEQYKKMRENWSSSEEHMSGEDNDNDDLDSDDSFSHSSKL